MEELTKQVELANTLFGQTRLNYLNQLKEVIAADDTIPAKSKKQLRSAIKKLEEEARLDVADQSLNKEVFTSPSSESKSSNLLFPDYGSVTDYAECVPSYKELIDPTKPYVSQMPKLLKYFFSIPNAEVQIPVICALALGINVRAFGNNVPVPVAYIYSRMQNSGKSTLAQWISLHYPPEGRVSAIASSTGASYRNSLHTANSIGTHPVCGIYDNWEPGTIAHLQGAYPIFLAYTPRDMQEATMVAGSGEMQGKSIKYDCRRFQIITSIFALSRQHIKMGSELESRSITIRMQRNVGEGLQTLNSYCFDNSSNPRESLYYEYFKVWNVETAYKFREVYYKVSPSAKIKDHGYDTNDDSWNIGLGRPWELTATVISAGIAVGVWKSIGEAIEAMLAYWEYRSRGEEDKSLLEIYLDEFLDHFYPSLIERGELLGSSIRLSMDHIPLNRLSDFLQLRYQIKTTTRTLEELISLFKAKGYRFLPGSYLKNKLGYSPTSAVFELIKDRSH